MIQRLLLEGGQPQLNNDDISNEISRVKDILCKPVDDGMLKEKISNENNKINISNNKYFEFSVHKPTNTIVVKIVDSQTNQVIDEIPPEKILDLVAGLWKIAGLFVDRKI
ncbi:MAG: flagellar protein FlaG [Thermoanaerobacteraceae bacterium]|jgi:flagellar protein FlaG|nr:flagellar protein FlaG [Thermoanaerobacteraceae bacterium]